MKKILSLPLLIIFLLLLNSSLIILNFENQDTNVYDEIEDISQENREDIRSAEEEDDEDEEDEPDDEDGDGIDDETEKLNERLVEVEYSENEAQIESNLHNGYIKDKIAIKMQAEDEGLKIKVDYLKNIKNKEYDLEFETIFSTLIEFIDNNNDSIFTEDEDTLLHEIPLDSFNDFQYSLDLINNTTKIHYFQISTTDGNLIFHIFFVEEYYELNTTLLIPTQMKIDIS